MHSGKEIPISRTDAQKECIWNKLRVQWAVRVVLHQNSNNDKPFSLLFSLRSRFVTLVNKMDLLKFAAQWVNVLRHVYLLITTHNSLLFLYMRRLNQFGTAVLVWCGKSVKFDRVCRTFVELNLGSTHGTPSESDVAPVSLQSRIYSVRFGTWKVRRLNQASVVSQAVTE